MKFYAIILILILQVVPVAQAAVSSKNFGGIGIDGSPWVNGRIAIKQLVEGGPAHLAGVKVGDVITHIDGKPTDGSNFKEMVQFRLRGRAGTPVTIKVRRPGEYKPYTFTIIRRQLTITPQKQ